MATALIKDNEERGLRLRLLIKESPAVLLDKLCSELKLANSSDLELELKKPAAFYPLRKLPNHVLSHAQLQVLYPPTGTSFDVSYLDVTVIYVLFRNLTFAKKTWMTPPPGSVQQKVIRLKDLRNKIAHGPLEVSLVDFQTFWADISTALIDLGGDPIKIQNLESISIDGDLYQQLKLMDTQLKRTDTQLKQTSTQLHQTSKNLKDAEAKIEEMKNALEGTWYAVPENIPTFVEREEILDNVRKLFLEKDCDAVQPVVLRGPGGVGKSELAIKYCRQDASSHGNNVMWINAETRTTLQTSFDGLAEELGLKDDYDCLDDTIKKTYNFFAGNKKKSLFVFDNISNANTLRPYLPVLPPCSVIPHILVTTQCHEWRLNVLVDVFSEETAINFLTEEFSKCSFVKDHILLPKLVEKLSYLPLALQQCASVIKTLKISISAYLEAYERNFRRIFDKPLPQQRYIRTAITCIQMNIDSLKDDVLALQILYISSFLDGKGIGKRIFTMLPDVDEFDVKEAIVKLTSRCLMKDDVDTILMHSLTRKVIRVLLDEKSQINEFVVSSLKLLYTLMDREAIGCQYNYGDEWRQHIITIVSECRKEEGGLLVSLDQYIQKVVFSFECKCLFGAAENFLRKLLRRIESKDDSDILNILTSVKILIYFSLIKQEKYEDAVTTFQAFNPAMASTVELEHSTKDFELPHFLDGTLQEEYIWKRFLLLIENSKGVDYNSEVFRQDYDNIYMDKDDLQTKLLVKKQLGIREKAKGNYAKALGYFTEVYDLQVETLGERHVDTVDALYWMNRSLYEQGEYISAEKGFKDVYDIRVETLGELHKHTVETLYWLNVSLYKQGEYITAEMKLREVYYQMVEILGERHELTLSTMYRINKALYEQGLYEEAHKGLRDLYNLCVEVLGVTNEYTLATLYWTNRSLYEQEMYAKAYKGFNDLYNVRVDVLGLKHKDTVKTLYWTYMCLYEQGECIKAYEGLKELHQVYTEVYGEEHEETSNILFWVEYYQRKIKQSKRCVVM